VKPSLRGVIETNVYVHLLNNKLFTSESMPTLQDNYHESIIIRGALIFKYLLGHADKT